MLTPRLLEIANLIPKGSKIADIGTDHAYIPIYCAKNSIIETALACDINVGPLKIAEKNIKSENLSGVIKTRLSNGLENIEKNEADAIIIAGMGGKLICDILSASLDKIDDDTLLILQPMIAADEVRQFLYDNDFCITNEVLAKEGIKIYNIITAKRGKCDFCDYDITVGKFVMDNKPDIIFEYIKNKIRITEKILNGLQKSSADKKDEIEKHTKELNLYKSVLLKKEDENDNSK